MGVKGEEERNQELRESVPVPTKPALKIQTTEVGVEAVY